MHWILMGDLSMLDIEYSTQIKITNTSILFISSPIAWCSYLLMLSNSTHNNLEHVADDFLWARDVLLALFCRVEFDGAETMLSEIQERAMDL